VFRDVAVEAEAAADGTMRFTRLAIGGRLLIYVLGAPSADSLPGRVRELARRGLRERDAMGYNRFRLAVTAVEVEGLEGIVSEAFGQAAGTDGKAHAHVVPSHAVPCALLPAQAVLNDRR
jgi:hypothetical protein